MSPARRRLVFAAAVALVATVVLLGTRGPGLALRAIGRVITLPSEFTGTRFTLRAARALGGGDHSDTLAGLRRRLEAMDAEGWVYARGGDYIVEVEAQGDAARDLSLTLLAARTLELRPALRGAEEPWLEAAARDASGRFETPSDGWMAPDGTHRRDRYLLARDRAALEAFVNDQIAQGGLAGRVAYERVDRRDDRDRDARPPGVFWRTWVLGDAVLTGRHVAGARVEFDELTRQPQVRLDFTDAGASIFADFTAAHVGDKLAIVVDGTVASAPVIQDRIGGGAAVINMGEGEPDELLLRARALAASLAGDLPAPMAIVASAAVRGTRGGLFWLVGVAALGGLVLGGLAWLAAGWAARLGFVATLGVPAAASGAALAPPPWRALGVTLVALPIAWLAPLAPLPGVPGVLAEELRRLGGGYSPFTLFALGLVPALAAALVVELVALAVPPLRARRHAGAQARRPLRLAALALTVAFAAVQGWLVALHLRSLAYAPWSYLATDVEIGRGAVWLIVASLVGGVLVLVIAAELLGRHGLVNGWAALLGAAALHEAWLAAARRLNEGATPAQLVVGAGAALAVALLAAAALAGRARRHPEGPSVRLPTTGVVPLAETAALGLLVPLLLDLGAPLPSRLLVLAQPGRARSLVLLAILIALGALLSWAWARPRPVPGLVADLRARGADPAALAALFRRALVASLLWLAALAVLGDLGARFALVPLLSTVLLTALVLDGLAAWRAGRRLGPVVAVHEAASIPRADAAVARLADAGIPALAHGAHVRALYHVFAPWAPIGILVPAARAAEAREVLERATLRA